MGMGVGGGNRAARVRGVVSRGGGASVAVSGGRLGIGGCIGSAAAAAAAGTVRVVCGASRPWAGVAIL